MSKLPVTFAILSALTLAACGDTNLEQAGTGGLAGAAAGEVLFDEPLAGAAIGAAGGALSDGI